MAAVINCYLENFKSRIFVHLFLRAFVIFLKASWTFSSQLPWTFACE